MSRETNPAVSVGALPRWFPLVCFALIILLIHNPYLTGPSGVDGLNVSHRPSYRATIAASELQHFSAPGNPNAFTALAARVSKDFEPLQADARQPLVYVSQVASPPQQFWRAGLWFRPPPVSSL
jgi:hypothetical protein